VKIVSYEAPNYTVFARLYLSYVFVSYKLRDQVSHPYEALGKSVVFIF